MTLIHTTMIGAWYGEPDVESTVAPRYQNLRSIQLP